MTKILLFDPSISTLNIGDQIITESINYELSNILESKRVIRISTHLPLSNYTKLFNNIDIKLALGSNLLRSKINKKPKQWDVGYKDIMTLKDLILVGVGWWQYESKVNMLSLFFYKKILNSKFFHSVRDSYTEKKLNEIGFQNVINTGCPTMWRFDKKFCAMVNTKKSDNVIFTLTDYNKNENMDRILIEILIKNYNKVYFFPQGIDDNEYLKKIYEGDQINIIYESLKDYNSFLENNIVDYIGTRLHAGIKAIQKFKRTIIIGIDNRAIEKSKDFNLKVIKRVEIHLLQDEIYKDLPCDIKIPIKMIQKWKEQFEL